MTNNQNSVGEKMANDQSNWLAAVLSQIFSSDPEERKKGIRGLVVAIILLGLLILWIAKG